MSKEIGIECLEEVSKTLGITVQEAKASFDVWMYDTFPDIMAECETTDGLDDEDYNHFADAYALATMPRTGGGGGGEEWAGMFIGFVRRFDMMRRKRDMAIDIATADLGGAINNGFTYNGNKVGIGRAFIENGVWNCEHSKGTYVSKDTSDAKPNWVIPLNEQVSIAMLKTDNTPQMAYSVKSVWTFLGNSKESILEEGPMVLTVEGSWEAAKHDWPLWKPCLIRGKYDESGWNDSGPTFTVSNSNTTYGLDWVPHNLGEQAAAMFAPEQYLALASDHTVNLKDLLEHHLTNRTESFVDSNGNQRYNGPLTIAVGGVMDINHEGKESQWDSTGRDYYLSLSTQVLRRENPNARIGVSVSGLLHDNFNGMNVKKNGVWLPYARGSRVWVVGQTDTYTNQDGVDVVKINAHGIYAIPAKSIPAQKPSEDSNNLGNLDGFGVGGDE